MEDDTRDLAAREAFVVQMEAQMRQVAEAVVGKWDGAADLAALEQVAMQSAQQLGQALLSGLCQLAASRPPEEVVACECGAEARYQRRRTVQTRTILGTVKVRRAYYLCASCGQGRAPLDQQLGLCAGGFSAGLSELLAYLGVTQDSFAQASTVLRKLSLLSVCANSVRAESERLGALVVAEEQAQLAQAWQVSTTSAAAPPTTPPPPAPERLYISMDGVMVHQRPNEWKECKVGACYTTTTRPDPRHVGQHTVHAQDLSFVADLVPAEQFGRLLWLEAARRGVEQAGEVVVLGDGAEWIWNVAAEHFPGATQIVDWYHASHYVWQAAHALHEEPVGAQRWAKRALTALWEGRLRDLCANLNKHKALPGVQTALTYFLNNQQRMRYHLYRARGLQIGSGTIESSCKQVVTQRLKLAGMRWQHAHARAMVKLRARFKSDRWAETVALRPPPARQPRQRAA